MFHSYMNISQQETENGLETPEQSPNLPSSNNLANEQVQTSNTTTPSFPMTHLDSIIHQDHRSIPNPRSETNPILSQTGSSLLHPTNTAHIRTQPVPTGCLQIHQNSSRSTRNTLTQPIDIQQDNSFNPYQRTQEHISTFNQRSSSQQQQLPLPQPFNPTLMSTYDQSTMVQQRQNSQHLSSELPIRVASPVHPTPQHSSSRVRLPLPSDSSIYNSNLISTGISLNQLPSPVIPETIHTTSNMISRMGTTFVRRNHLQPQRSPSRRKKRSYVWKFFTEAAESSIHGSTALCKLCSGKVPRGKHNQKNTTNLIKHLQHRHPDVAAEATRKSIKEKDKSIYGVISGSSSSPKNNNDLQSNGYQDITRDNNQYFARSLVQGSSSYNNNNNRDGTSTIHPSTHTRGRSSASPPFGNGLGSSFHQDIIDRPIRSTPSPDDALVMSAPLRNTSNSNIPPLTATAGQELANSNHGNTNHQGLEIENGNQNRQMDYTSWPNRVSPSRRFHNTRLNDTDELLNDESGMDFGEMNSAIMEFFAMMGLPLSASKSRALDGLIRTIQNRNQDLNLTKSRTTSFSGPVKAMQTKIRTLLSDCERLFLTVSKKGENRFLICQYYGSNFDAKYVCLDVLHPSDLEPTQTSGNDGHLTEVSSGVTSQRQDHQDNEDECLLSTLLDRIAQTLNYWDIRNKVYAVVISEKGISTERKLYLPDHSSSDEYIPSLFRDVSDSSSKSSRRQSFHREGNLGYNHDGTTRISRNCRKIPVLPCMMNVLEDIAERTICNNQRFEHEIILPLTRGIFRAFTDGEFKRSSVANNWKKGLEVPLCKPSMKDLLEIIRFYRANMDLIRDAVKRSNDPRDFQILYIALQDIQSLQCTLEKFEKAIKMSTPNRKDGILSNQGRASTVLPLMWELLRDLEDIENQSTESFKQLLCEVIDTVKLEWRRFESHELYAFATAFDSRFKFNYFITGQVRETIRDKMLYMCEEETRRTENNRMNRNNDVIINSIPQNGTTDFLDSIVQSEKTAAFQAISTYETQSASAKMQNIDEYWNEKKCQWPMLAKVASRYVLLPSISQSEIMFENNTIDIREMNDNKGKRNCEELMMEFMRCNLIHSEKTSSLL